VALLQIEQELAAGEKALGAARTSLERSLREHRAAGAAALEAEVLGLLGLADEIDGRKAAARGRYEEAAVLLRAAERAPLEGLFLAYLGRVEASSGRLAEAREALDEARARVFATGVRSLASVYDLCEGHVAVAEGRAARARGDDRSELAHTDRARRALATSAFPSPHVRLARILLDRDLSDLVAAASPAAEPARPEVAAGDALVVSASGRWFAPPRGQRVSLDTRHALRLILGSLAQQREASPGTPLDVAALLQVGWPGERVLHDAGASRVYTAVAQLRREGLRDLLLRRDDGYLLDPGVAIARAAD
jgi:tetratricopeptide (TPR) repeat protein